MIDSFHTARQRGGKEQGIWTMRKLALAVAAATAMLYARAEAAVYTLENVAYDASNPAGFGYLASNHGVTLTIADSAVARGLFQLSYNNSRQVVGDISDFVSVRTPSDGVYAAELTQSQFSTIGSGSFALTFDGTGAVSTASFSFFGVSDDVYFSGVNSNVSGGFSSDASGVGACGRFLGECTFVGQFIPEPATLLLMALPMLAVGLARRRIKWSSSAR